MAPGEQRSDLNGLLPEQRVGAAMRQARESREVSLREMARRLNYSSHTTLVAYEHGDSMPADQVVKGYEQVLGLEPGSLREVLESARIERHGDAWAKRRIHLPVEFVSADGSKAPVRETPRRGVAWLRGRRALVVSIIPVILLVGGGAVSMALQRDRPKAPSTSSTVLVPDGSDPKVAGCADGATTIDTVDVFDPPQHLVGVMELRSSARCGASWGRFSPNEFLSPTPTVMVEINVRRPADGAVAPFRIAYPGRNAPVYGNMLVSRHECVYAEVTLKRAGRASPVIRTKCYES